MVDARLPDLEIEVEAKTDVGCVREANEDSFSVFIPENQHLLETRGRMLLVADGMGGALGGETASSMVSYFVSETYYKHSAGLSIPEALRQALTEANAKVFERATCEPALRGMGSTCTAAVIHNRGLWLAHVGDSRCYLIRDKRILQLTDDHSKVAQMVADKLIDKAEAAIHPERSVLLRCIGPRVEVDVDVSSESTPLQEGDRLLLCSDGLSGFVDERVMLEIVDRMSPAEAVDALIERAKARGGDDNITVQVARVGSDRRAPTTLPPHQAPTTEIENGGIRKTRIDEALHARRPANALAATRGRRPLLIVGGVVLLVLIGLISWTILSDREPHDPRVRPSALPSPAASNTPPRSDQPPESPAPESGTPGPAQPVPVTDQPAGQRAEDDNATSPSPFPAAPPDARLSPEQLRKAIDRLKRQIHECSDFHGALQHGLQNRIGVDVGPYPESDAVLEDIARAIALYQSQSKPLVIDGQAGPETQKQLLGKTRCPSASQDGGP